MTYNDSLKILLAYDVKIAFGIFWTVKLQYKYKCYLAAHVTSLRVQNLKTYLDSFIFSFHQKASMSPNITYPTWCISSKFQTSWLCFSKMSRRSPWVSSTTRQGPVRSRQRRPHWGHHLLYWEQVWKPTRPRWEWKSSLYLGKKIAP